MINTAAIHEMIAATDKVLVVSKVRSKTEAELEKKLAKLFSRIEDDIIRELKRTKSSVSAIAPLKSSLTELDELILDVTMRELEGLLIAQERLARGTFTASKRTINRMSGNVLDIITQGYADGVGVDEIARNLRPAFSDMADYELKRIARTETHHATNVAGYERKRQAGINYHKWITAGDGRVRNEHVKLSGQIVRVGDPFGNGLKHPGDRSGPVKEWINCRCQAIAFIMPIRKLPPPGKTQFRENELIGIKN